VLNECTVFRRGRGDLLTAPKRLVLQDYWARPKAVQLMVEGLGGSAGGSYPKHWVGLTEAGRIIVHRPLGVAITSTDWSQRVGVGGSETS